MKFAWPRNTFGDMAEDIKPIIPAGSSDPAALDAVFEVMVRSGRSAPMTKTMLVPEAWSKATTDMPKALGRHVCLLQRRDGALGRVPPRWR